MRILSLSYDQIIEEVRILDNEVKQIKDTVLKMAWYMRGAIPIDDAFAMGVEDREIVSKIIEENLETTKKSGLPFF
jgi:hypothetical protein